MCYYKNDFRTSSETPDKFQVENKTYWGEEKKKKSLISQFRLLGLHTLCYTLQGQRTDAPKDKYLRHLLKLPPSVHIFLIYSCDSVTQNIFSITHEKEEMDETTITSRCFCIYFNSIVDMANLTKKHSFFFFLYFNILRGVLFWRKLPKRQLQCLTHPNCFV